MADMVGRSAPPDGAEHEAGASQGEFYAIDASIMAPVLGPIDADPVVAFNRMLKVAGRGHGIIGHGLFTDRWWRRRSTRTCRRCGRRAVTWPAAPLGVVITAVDDEDRGAPARRPADDRLLRDRQDVRHADVAARLG
jgi:hypothetical protein